MIKKNYFQPIILLLGAAILVACGPTTPAPESQSASTSASVAPAEQSTVTTIPQTGGTSPSASMQDPCTFLTKDDVGAVLGQTVDTTQGNTAGKVAGSCSYSTKDLQLLFSVMYTGGAQSFQSLLTAAGQNTTAVTGLGDAAFINNTSNSLDVLKGDQEFSLFVIDTGNAYSTDQTAGMEKSLAQKLLAGLH